MSEAEYHSAPHEQSGEPEVKAVLVVDDVNLMCHFLYETLNPLDGIETRTTGNFSSAESILMNSEIDMAIIDIHLNNASGLTLAKKIREGRYQCKHDIPILIFSGNTYKNEIQMCLAYDITDIMAKPLKAGMVRSRVRKALSKRVQIHPPEYYQTLVASGGEEYKTEFEGIKKKRGPEKSAQHRVNAAKEPPTKKSSFIQWPDDLTTGYHQLDRRLKHITHLINMLHYRKCSDEKYPNIEEDVKQIRLAVDDVLYVARRLQHKNSDCMWRIFFQRLTEFSNIKIEAFIRKTSNVHSVKQQFKLLRSKWLAILTKPVMKATKEE